MADLADQLVLEGNLEEAKVMYDSASVAQERAWGTGRWFVPRRYVQLSEVRYQLGRYTAAETSARHAVEIYLRNDDTTPRSFNTGNAYLALGRSLLAQGQRLWRQRPLARASPL